jgi:hypothetical protein
MLKTMSSNDREAKLAASRQFLTTCSGLALTLAVSDRPAWLTELLDCTEWYVANHNDRDANHTHLMKIIARYEQAMNHEWLVTEEDASVDYSFDGAYQRHQKESSVLDLFDAMENTLNHMIESCEIDSVSAIGSLSQLIVLIDQNKSGSYFSILACQDFITRFLKNTTWMQIRKIPGVKTFKDTFEKITKDMDAELDRIHKDILAEIQDRYDTSIKPLAHKNVKKQLTLVTAESV